MVICKFYRQGNCRYGQYCQFEHVNNFGNPKADFINEDDVCVTVANEILLAERGGQWLLSCFAPFKEYPNIPGMKDFSPEEIRWEMYQAQKNGMVEQAKLHFQQLSQDMKAKREALKNPNREMITMLKKLLGGNNPKNGLDGSNNTAVKTSTNISFTAPQLGLVNTTLANNVFGKKPFSVQSNNPFSKGFNSSNNTLIFGKSNNNSNPIFGGTPTFGNNLGFGTTANTNSIFGGITNTSTFNVQNTPTFGTVGSQNNSIFGGSSQNVFGQSNVFGGTNQLVSQSSTSTFNSSATPSTSLFKTPITSQANSLFGGTNTTTNNLFGGSPSTQTNPVFGATTSSSPFNAGIFNQPKTLPAFGGAPVFGGVTNFANNSSSLFGQTFCLPTIPTSNIFGSVTTTPATFNSSTVTTTPAFGLGQQSTTFGTTTSTPNVFGTQNPITMPASNSTPFGGPVATISTPFMTTNSQFGSTNTTSRSTFDSGFNVTTSTSNIFGPTVTSSNSLFSDTGTTFVSSSTNVPNPLPFSTPTFGNLNASPFGAVITTTTTTTATTTTTNPFASHTQQSNLPFGNITEDQSISSPFGKSPFSITVTSTIINDSIYAADGLLTDDEKSMYLAEKFIIGKIPLKPPTKDVK